MAKANMTATVMPLPDKVRQFLLNGEWCSESWTPANKSVMLNVPEHPADVMNRKMREALDLPESPVESFDAESLSDISECPIVRQAIEALESKYAERMRLHGYEALVKPITKEEKKTEKAV